MGTSRGPQRTASCSYLFCPSNQHCEGPTVGTCARNVWRRSNIDTSHGTCICSWPTRKRYQHAIHPRGIDNETFYCLPRSVHPRIVFPNGSVRFVERPNRYV
eukprot:PhF_6_TR25260/c0_g1_i1/m.34800